MALSIDDQLAIQRLYAVYCHAIDDGDGKAFAACFTAEGSLEAGLGDAITGTDALVAFVDGVAAGMPGLRHQVTNVAVDGADTDATGRAYLYAYRAGAAGHEVVITGRYADTLKKVDGEWRFVDRRLAPDTPA